MLTPTGRAAEKTVDRSSKPESRIWSSTAGHSPPIRSRSRPSSTTTADGPRAGSASWSTAAFDAAGGSPSGSETDGG